MGKKFAVAFALVALMAAPAFASVQNVKVGGSLATTSVIRNSFDLGANAVTQNGQNVVLSQVGLNVQADLTDNVSTKIGLTNESLWGNGGTSTKQVNVDTAYVMMKELLYSPLTLTVGRQPLAYGNQFLIGDGDSTTAVTEVGDLTGGVNFDAVKAVLSYDPLTVDLFAAKISETVMVQNDTDDSDLFGVNVNYKLGDKMSTVVEAYTFVKNDKTAVNGTHAKAQKLYVPGLRVSTNPIEGLNVQLEGAYQTGNTVANTEVVKAYGIQGKANYALPVMKNMKPVVSAGYTYLSGDKNTGDSKNTAFSSLYENQNVGRIFDTLFTMSNLAIAEVAFEVTPIQDLTTKLSLYNLAQVKKSTISTINQPTGSAQTVAGNNKKELGNELDFDVTYAYTEDVKFGVSAGMFMPGKAFSAANKDSASQILTSVEVAF